MNIIKPGNLDNVVYTGYCKHCGVIIECLENECSYDVKEVFINCPTKKCGYQIILITKQ